MDTQELIELLPRIVSHVEGLADYRTVLPPAPGVTGGSVYACENGPAVVTFMVNSDAALAITAGVAKDIEMRTDVGRHVNELNAGVLMVGRLYYKEESDTARGAVLLQEIVNCGMFDGGPSINVLLDMIARVAGMAKRLSPELCERHGGRPWPPDEALLVSMLGG